MKLDTFERCEILLIQEHNKHFSNYKEHGVDNILNVKIDALNETEHTTTTSIILRIYDNINLYSKYNLIKNYIKKYKVKGEIRYKIELNEWGMSNMKNDFSNVWSDFDMHNKAIKKTLELFNTYSSDYDIESMILIMLGLRDIDNLFNIAQDINLIYDRIKDLKEFKKNNWEIAIMKLLARYIKLN